MKTLAEKAEELLLEAGLNPKSPALMRVTEMAILTLMRYEDQGYPKKLLEDAREKFKATLLAQELSLTDRQKNIKKRKIEVFEEDPDPSKITWN